MTLWCIRCEESYYTTKGHANDGLCKQCRKEIASGVKKSG